jgi:hypothetical protein
MRDLFSKVLTGSMIASAALLVAACGGGGSGDEANNTTTEMGTTDPMMDTNTGDVTAIDGAGATGDNMAMDANAMTMDANTAGTATTMNTTDTGATTNGM